MLRRKLLIGLVALTAPFFSLACGGDDSNPPGTVVWPDPPEELLAFAGFTNLLIHVPAACFFFVCT